MKCKLFGLAGLAVLAFIVIGGTGSASATVLCKMKPAAGTPETCPAGQEVPAGETIHFHLKPTTKALLNTQAEVNVMTCQESELQSTVTKANQVEGKFESARFQTNKGKCATTLGVNTEYIVENLPWTMSFSLGGTKLSQDSTENVAWGKVKFSEQEGKQLQFRQKQGALLDCLYKAKINVVEGEIINGTTGASQVIFGSSQSDFEEKEPKKAVCPDTTRYAISYEITRGAAQENVYIAK